MANDQYRQICRSIIRAVMKQFLSTTGAGLSDAQVAFHHGATSTIWALPAPPPFQCHR